MGETNSQDFCYVRLLNAVVNSNDIKFYFNDKLTAENLGYGVLTEYTKAGAGQYSVRVAMGGLNSEVGFTETVNLAQGVIYTIAAVGNTENMGIEIISDVPRETSGNAQIRVANLSTLPETVDVFANETELAHEIKQGETTRYMEVAPGLYEFKIAASKNGRILYVVSGIRLEQKKITGAYFIGTNFETEDSLKILFTLEGATYLK